MKNVLLIFLLSICFCTFKSSAQTKTIDRIKYRITSKEYQTVEVTKTKIEGYITIPSTIIIGNKEYTVTRIGDSAFDGGQYFWLGLTGITIPNSVISIGRYAFRNAFNGNKTLSPVIIPTSVIIIEAHAFERCMAPIIIPNSVTKIEEKAFDSCNRVSYELPNWNDANILSSALLTQLGDNIRYEFPNWHVSITFPSALAAGEEITEKVKKEAISDILLSAAKKNLKAFEFCSNITFKIPPVSRIPKGMFYFFDCSKLNIILPNTVTTIEEDAFNFSNIQTINIPAVDSIGKSAFSSSQLQSVTIPGPVTIGDFAFSRCSKLTEVKISPSTNIGYSAFSDCENLKTVSLIGNAVSNHNTRIEEGAFRNCKALTSITIPNSVKYIHKDAFEGCYSIKEIKGLNSTIEYDKYTFNNTELIAAIEKTFSYSAFGKVYKGLTEWQSKKEFETTAQWKDRVTEEGRKKKIKQLTEEAQAEYIAKFSPIVSRGALDSYDADYNTYAVTFGDAGKQYINVPVSDAPQVKANWNKAIINPAWGVKGDKLAVTGLSVKIGNKTYLSPQKVKDDEITELSLNLPPLELNLAPEQYRASSSNENASIIDNSIDLQIPVVSISNPKTFAVIIGNENYQRVAKVPYALNDAKVFSNYCLKTLGIPANNIRSYKDATYGTLLAMINDIKSIAKAYNGNIHLIFYYAGHGVPDENSKSSYLLPVDADGTQTEICYSINRLYKELNTLQAQSILVFMDACFSGAQRGEGMLASARGVALKARTETPQGNMVVFSATNGEETAFPYKEKGHGLFTYFLLRKLQETKGNVTLQELGEYISTQVQQQSIIINRKSQSPTVLPSINMGDSWKTMKLIQ